MLSLSLLILNKDKVDTKKNFISVNFFLKKNDLNFRYKKNENFHARYDAKLRTYEYLIVNRLGTLSINHNKAWHVKKKIDLKLMKKALMLKELMTFLHFELPLVRQKLQLKNKKIKISKNKDFIRIKITQNRFYKIR